METLVEGSIFWAFYVSFAKIFIKWSHQIKFFVSKGDTVDVARLFMPHSFFHHHSLLSGANRSVAYVVYILCVILTNWTLFVHFFFHVKSCDLQYVFICSLVQAIFINACTVHGMYYALFLVENNHRFFGNISTKPAKGWNMPKALTWASSGEREESFHSSKWEEALICVSLTMVQSAHRHKRLIFNFCCKCG